MLFYIYIIGGIVDSLSGQTMNMLNISGNTWDRWFAPTLKFIDKYNIKIWNYMNTNYNNISVVVNSSMVTDSIIHNLNYHNVNLNNMGDANIADFKDLVMRWIDLVSTNSRYSWAFSANGMDNDKTISDNCLSTKELHRIDVVANTFGILMVLIVVAIAIILINPFISTLCSISHTKEGYVIVKS